MLLLGLSLAQVLVYDMQSFFNFDKDNVASLCDAGTGGDTRGPITPHWLSPVTLTCGQT